MINENLKISILVDNPDSWIVPYAEEIVIELSKKNECELYFDSEDISEGDILFLLGCTTIIPKGVLRKNKHNFVVHESELPQGRGWSPVSWQVLEGRNSIPIVLFEAVEQIDAGPIYLRDSIELDGTELLPEIKRKQAEKTEELIFKLIDKWPDIKGRPQTGKGSYYRRRGIDDDRLDVNKTIAEQFNHLRIVDNKRYPAWFEYKGQEYYLKIYKKTSGPMVVK